MEIFTDVDDMSLAINHNVPVVPVLDLENVAYNGVGSHRLNEVQPSFLKLDGVLATVFCDKEVQQIVDFCSSHLIARCGVWHNVNNTALRLC